MHLSFSKNCVFAFTLVFVAFGSTAHAHVGKKCLTPLLEAIDKAEESLKKPLTYSITAPVECQYFQVSDLDEETRGRINTLVKAQGKIVSLDAKLTSVFGLLRLTPREPDTKKIDPCENYFFTLDQNKTKYLEKVNEASDRKACFELSNTFLKEAKSLPTDCDNPIEVTSRDFRDLLAGLGRSYKAANQKILPERLAFAYTELKNWTYKMLNEKCGRL